MLVHELKNIMTNLRVAVIIPCYKVKDHILFVISKIGTDIDVIYVVDDGCPEFTGNYVNKNCSDLRVKVLYNIKNKGVGGAVIHGYTQAIQDNIDIVIKIDGDGQMNPELIPRFIRPISTNTADYVKGNRFFSPESLESMPRIRLIGNAVLSFFTKLSSGYWDIMDPTNGYTAIHLTALKMLPLHKINNGYFFESDMLFRLGTIRAVVFDLPMVSLYGSEKSNLNIRRVICEFPINHINRFYKRIFYSYFLRDFNIASVELIVGFTLLSIGTIYGLYRWYLSISTGILATSGTANLASLFIILGVQFLLAAINYDILTVPKKPLQRLYIDHTC